MTELTGSGSVAAARLITAIYAECEHGIYGIYREYSIYRKVRQASKYKQEQQSEASQRTLLSWNLQISRGLLTSQAVKAFRTYLKLMGPGCDDRECG